MKFEVFEEECLEETTVFRLEEVEGMIYLQAGKKGSGVWADILRITRKGTLKLSQGVDHKLLGLALDDDYEIIIEHK